MRYRWQDNASLIQEVIFTGKGGTSIREAIIAAPPQGQDDPKLQELDTLLADCGYNVSYDIRNHAPVLRVSGIRAESDLVNLLKKEQLVAGPTQATELKERNKSNWQMLRDNSLVLSAVFYMLGNLSTALSGWFRRDNDELRTGLSFSVGDTFMLLFGKQSDKEKHENVMQGFGEFMREHGYIPSTGSNFATSAVKDGKSNWKTIKKTMKKLVIPVKSVSEIYAGYSFAKAGINQDNPYKKVAGTALITGFSAGLLIPERSKSQIRDKLGVDTPEQAKEKYKTLSTSKRMQYAIQRQPLIISGGFAALNNLSTIASAFDERDNVKKTGENRQLAKIMAELYGGRSYKPSLFQEEKHVPKSESVKGKIKESYREIADIKNKLDSSKSDSGEKGRLLGQLNYKEKNNAKLLEEESQLRKQRDNQKNGRTVPLFGKVDQKNFWIFNLLQGGFFLIANTLYGMSSKTTNGDKKLVERFIASVATEISKSPNIDERIELTSLAAQYGGQLEEMDYTVGEIRAMIEQRVTELEANPWLEKYREAAERKLLVEIDPNELPKKPEEKEVHGEKAPVAAEEKAPMAAKEKKPASFTERVTQPMPENEHSHSAPLA